MADMFWKKYSVEINQCIIFFLLRFWLGTHVLGIDDSQHYPNIEDTLLRTSKELEQILMRLIPEFGPFQVKFNMSNTISCDDTLGHIIKYICVWSNLTPFLLQKWYWPSSFITSVFVWQWSYAISNLRN